MGRSKQITKSMNSLQIAFDFDKKPEEIDEEQVAHDCFWKLHGAYTECDCKLNWDKWEQKTGRKIWDIA